MGACGSKDATKTESTNDQQPQEQDENGSDFLYEFETDSDEIKLDPVESWYTDPTASEDAYKRLKMSLQRFQKSSTDENGNILLSQKELDAHAANATPDAASSFKELVAYLEQPITNHPERNALMVRAILAWLSSQNTTGSSDGNNNSSADTNTPAGYIQLLAQKKTTFSTFFTVLCRKSNIPCAQVHGICKAGDYQPGDLDKLYFSMWNAVYIDDNWHIVHPFWACQSVFGKVSGGWIKLEEGGKTVGQRQTQAAGIIKNSFDDYYIVPNPREFLYACHPDDQKWQLVKKPITRRQFLEQAYLLPPFWGFGMQMISQDKCFLSSRRGKAQISFKSPLKTGNELDVWYELLFKEDDSTSSSELLNPENIPKLVSLVRNTPEWNCIVQCPVEGVYKIVFYAGMFGKSMARVGEFKLICDEAISKCDPLPFDPGRLGLGPGPKSEKAGLLLPSRRNGIIQVDKNKGTRIRFFISSEVLKTLVVKTSLVTNSSIQDEALQEELNKTVSCTMESSGKENNMQTSARELIITTPPDQQDDNRYLRIYTGHRSKEKSDVSKSEMSIVCNYCLTTEKQPTFENGSKRFSRRNLLKAMEGENIEEIEKCISQCEKNHIPSDDGDLEYARQKIEVLTLRKAIHEARIRRNLSNTEFTIKQIRNSRFSNIFQRDIQLLERQADSLSSLRGFTQELPRLLDAVLELRHRTIPSDIVQNILLALLTLFGKTIDENEDFETIQWYCKKLCGRLTTQKESSDFTQDNARNAQSMMDEYTLEERQTNTMAAAKLHLWIDEVTKKVLQDFEEKDPNS